MGKTSIVIVGHGSKNQASIKEQETLIEMLSRQMPDCRIENAYLQFCQPNIHQVIEALSKQDVRSITIVPLLLFAGVHVQKEIPELVNGFRSQYPQIEFILTGHLGADMHIVNLVRDRISSVDNQGDKGD